MSATAARPTAQDAVALAQTVFLAGERVEMGALAADLGINRTTLHRWFASRDLLLGAMLTELSRREFARARRAVAARPPAPLGHLDHTLAVLERFLRSHLDSPPFHAFCVREPATAVRVLMTASGGVELRSRAMLGAFLEEAAAAGLALSAPIDTLAVALIRVGEAFVYADVISGEEPDVSRAMVIYRLLLR